MKFRVLFYLVILSVLTFSKVGAQSWSRINKGYAIDKTFDCYDPVISPTKPSVSGWGNTGGVGYSSVNDAKLNVEHYTINHLFYKKGIVYAEILYDKDFGNCLASVYKFDTLKSAWVKVCPAFWADQYAAGMAKYVTSQDGRDVFCYNAGMWYEFTETAPYFRLINIPSDTYPFNVSWAVGGNQSGCKSTNENIFNNPVMIGDTIYSIMRGNVKKFGVCVADITYIRKYNPYTNRYADEFFNAMPWDIYPLDAKVKTPPHEEHYDFNFILGPDNQVHVFSNIEFMTDSVNATTVKAPFGVNYTNAPATIFYYNRAKKTWTNISQGLDYANLLRNAVMPVTKTSSNWRRDLLYVKTETAAYFWDWSGWRLIGNMAVGAIYPTSKDLFGYATNVYAIRKVSTSPVGDNGTIFNGDAIDQIISPDDGANLYVTTRQSGNSSGDSVGFFKVKIGKTNLVGTQINLHVNSMTYLGGATGLNAPVGVGVGAKTTPGQSGDIFVAGTYTNTIYSPTAYTTKDFTATTLSTKSKRGKLLHLNYQGTSIKEVIILGDSLYDYDIQNKGEYRQVVTGDFGVAVLDSTGSKLLWNNTLIGMTGLIRGDIADNGDVVVSEVTNGPALGSYELRVFDKNGVLKSSTTYNKQFVYDVSIKSDTVFLIGGMAYTTPIPIRVPFLYALSYSSPIPIVLYKMWDYSAFDLAGPDEADNILSRVNVGRDNRVYVLGMSAGGNGIFRFDGSSIGATKLAAPSPPPSNNVKYDEYTDPYNIKGAPNLGYYARLDEKNQKVALGQFILPRNPTKGGSANTVDFYRGAIHADERGYVLIAGSSTYQLASRDAQLINGNPIGSYAGGDPMVAMVSPDFKTRVFWTTFARQTADGNSARGNFLGWGLRDSTVVAVAEQAKGYGITQNYVMKDPATPTEKYVMDTYMAVWYKDNWKYTEADVPNYKVNPVDSVVENPYTKVYPPPTKILVSVVDSSICAGSDFRVTYAADGTAGPLNNFKAELSDANGSFTNPVVVGTTLNRSSGVIYAKMLSSMPAGSKYRIRVSSTNPVVIGTPNSFDISVSSGTVALGAIKGETQLCVKNCSIIPIANLEQGKPVTSSSWAPYDSPAQAGRGNDNGAFDKNSTTLWHSDFKSGPVQWVAVDLGLVYNITGAKITYRVGEFAKKFRLQISGNGIDWADLVVEPAYASLANPVTYTGLAGRGRFFRFYGESPQSPLGYSIFDIELTGTACAGNNIQYKLDPIAGSPKYTWTLPSGMLMVSRSDTNLVTVNYGPAASGTLALSVENSCGISKTTLPVTVSTCTDTALFSASDTVICVGSKINLADESVGATTWDWTFAGGSPANATIQNPINITYSTVGKYDVTLTINKATPSKISTTVKSVRVVKVPTITGIVYQDITTCNGTGKATITLVTPDAGYYEADMDNDGIFEKTLLLLQGNTLVITGFTSGDVVNNPKVRLQGGTCASAGFSSAKTFTTPAPPVITNVQLQNPTGCTTNNGEVVITLDGSPLAGSYDVDLDNDGNFEKTAIPLVGNIITVGGYSGYVGTGYKQEWSVKNVTVRYSPGGCPSLPYVGGPKAGEFSFSVTPDFSIKSVTPRLPSSCDGSDGALVIKLNGTTATKLFDVQYISTDPNAKKYSMTLQGDSLVAMAFKSNDQINGVIISPTGMGATCTTSVYATTYTFPPAPATPVIDNVTYSNPTSCNAKDGKVILNLSPSSPNGTYDVDLNTSDATTFEYRGVNSVSNVITITGLGSGVNVFRPKVRYNGGCVSDYIDKNYTLLAPGAPLITQVDTLKPTSCAISNGKVTITLAATPPAGLYSVDYNGDGVYEITGVSLSGSQLAITTVPSGTAITNLIVKVGVCLSPVKKLKLSLVADGAPAIDTAIYTDPQGCGSPTGYVTLGLSGVNLAETPYDADLNNDGIFEKTNLSYFDPIMTISGYAGGDKITNIRVKNPVNGCVSQLYVTNHTFKSLGALEIESITATNPGCGIDGKLYIKIKDASAATLYDIDFNADGSIEKNDVSVNAAGVIELGGYVAGDIVNKVQISIASKCLSNIYAAGITFTNTGSSLSISKVIYKNSICAGNDGKLIIKLPTGSTAGSYTINLNINGANVDSTATLKGDSLTLSGYSNQVMSGNLTVKLSSSTCASSPFANAYTYTSGGALPSIASVNYQDPICVGNDGKLIIKLSTGSTVGVYKVNLTIGTTNVDSIATLKGDSLTLSGYSNQVMSGNLTVKLSSSACISAPIANAHTYIATTALPSIASVNYQDPSCVGNDGKLIIKLSGIPATGVYSIDLNNDNVVDSTATLKGDSLTLTGYSNEVLSGSLTIRQSATCVSSTKAYAHTYVSTGALPSIASVNYQDPTCVGNDGKLIIKLSGTPATGVYSIDLNNDNVVDSTVTLKGDSLTLTGYSTQALSGSLTIRQSATCVSSAKAYSHTYVSNGALPSIASMIYQDPSCIGNDGKLIIKLSGAPATGVYSIDLNNDNVVDSTATLKGDSLTLIGYSNEVLSGSLTIRQSATCVSSAKAYAHTYVSTGALPNIASVNYQDPTCVGNDGKLIIKLSGTPATGVYSIDLNNDNITDSTATLKGDSLTLTGYSTQVLSSSLTIRQSASCVSSAKAYAHTYIATTALLSIASVNYQDPICVGKDGKLIIKLSGTPATGVYSIDLNNDNVVDSTATLKGDSLILTGYSNEALSSSLTIRQSATCVSSAKAYSHNYVSTGALPSIASVNYQDPSCVGNDGKLIIKLSGTPATGVYSIDLNNDNITDSTVTLKGDSLTLTGYSTQALSSSLTIRQSASCVSSAKAYAHTYVSTGALPSIASVNYQDPSCVGNDGKLIIKLLGTPATGVYSIDLNNDNVIDSTATLKGDSLTLTGYSTQALSGSLTIRQSATCVSSVKAYTHTYTATTVLPSIASVNYQDPSCVGNDGKLIIVLPSGAASGKYDIDMNNDGVFDSLNVTSLNDSLTLSNWSSGLKSFSLVVRQSGSACVSNVLNTNHEFKYNATQPLAQTSATQVCVGGIAKLFVATSLTDIQWQTSLDGSTSWIDIFGATTALYDVNPIASINYYRAIVKDNICPDLISTVVSVEVVSSITSNLAVQGSKVCAGDKPTVTIDNSQVGVKYSLYSNSKAIGESVIGNGSTATIVIADTNSNLLLGMNSYSVKALLAGCAEVELLNSATVELLDSLQIPSIVGAEEVCPMTQGVYTIGAVAGATSYTWTVALGDTIKAGQGSTAVSVAFGLIDNYQSSITVFAQNALCKSDTATIQLAKKAECDTLFIPNVLSPSTDDANSTWNIKGLEKHPDVKVRVFNRWGSIVYESVGYTTPWAGITSDGKELPMATYYFTIDIKSKKKSYQGSVTVVR